jgi:1-pyrroline-5-carboxylate dehydrogenase
VTNHVEYRPLEGFVLAVSPFNFASMNNLAFAPALLGNTVLWKPAESASLVAHLSLQLLREAGLPAGVISLLPGAGAVIGGVALAHPDLAAVHFTGSTATLRHIWRTVGSNVAGYRDYPHIVGEAGGKDFILAHPSADVEALAVACVRGAFDYQGQKCAAASRLYVPRSLWSGLRERLIESTSDLVVGDPTRPGNPPRRRHQPASVLQTRRCAFPGPRAGRRDRRREQRRLSRLVRRPDGPGGGRSPIGVRAR